MIVSMSSGRYMGFQGLILHVDSIHMNEGKKKKKLFKIFTLGGKM